MLRITCIFVKSLMSPYFALFTAIFFSVVMDEDGANSSDQISKLIRLERWLRAEVGSDVKIAVGRCRRTNRSFLDVAARPKEMTFLSSFHLVFAATNDYFCLTDAFWILGKYCKRQQI